MGVRFLVVSFTLLAIFPCHFSAVSVAAQSESPAVTDGQILEGLRSIRDQLLVLKSEIDAKVNNPERPDPRNMEYARYRTAFETYQGKIGDLYRQLTGAYEQINRVYRTNPKSPAYKPMVTLYLEVKGVYDSVSTLFAAFQPPEKLQAVAIVSEDRRLNRQVATTVRANRSAAPETTADIFAAESSTYIGTFDAVEMFLQVRGDNAYYLFVGWKDEETDASGHRKDTFHPSVLRSEYFPKQLLPQIQTSQQHLEKALNLGLLIIRTKDGDQGDINRFFTRIKSYAREN
jgi:hypothetical protein